MQANFWKEYADLTGRSLDKATFAHERALQQQVEIFRAAGVDILAIEEYVAAKRLEYATDAASGAQRALLDYANEAKDAGAMVEQFLTSGIKHTEDALVNFAMTGKFAFKDFINSILQDIARLAARQAILGLLSAFLSGGKDSGVGNGNGLWSGSSPFTWLKFDTGGYTGDIPRDQIAGLVHGQEFVVNAPAVARVGRNTLEAINSGGVAGLRSGEVPAVLQRGENVLTRAQAASLAPLSAVRQAMAAGSSSVPPITVKNYGTPQTYEPRYTREGIELIAHDVATQVLYNEGDKAMSRWVANPNSNTSRSLGKHTKTVRQF